MTLSFYTGKKVAVTGGLGFIGSNLALTLARLGADVTVIDSNERACGANRFNLAEAEAKIRLVVADIADSAVVGPALRDTEVVFNLAGEISHIHSIRYPERDLDLNVRAQLGFLHCCRKQAPGARIVYASSRQLYGVPDYLPVNEQHPIRPVDFNGIHQWTAENYHLLFTDLYSMNVACLRLTNVYGPRQPLLRPCQGFSGTFFRLALQGEPIQVFGDGRQLRDMLYVDDAVDAFLRAGADSFEGMQIYNVGGSPPLSLLEIAEIIAGAAASNGKRSAVECVPFPEDRKSIDIGSYYSDITKIRSKLGWEPRIDFARGVRETVAFYRRFAEHYLSGPIHPPCQLETRPRELPEGVASQSHQGRR